MRILHCDNNKLTKLNLGKCWEIKEIYCQKNQLNDLILPDNANITHLNINSNLLSNQSIFKNLSSKLTYLDIRDNKFSKKDFPNQDLSFLGRFTELETLKLGAKLTNVSFALETIWSHSDRLLNSFGGSLESLKSMHKLGKLSIINTDINSGLEYLPLNLMKIRCGTTVGRGLAYKCSEICKKLEKVKDCSLGNNEYDLERWRVDKGIKIESETASQQNNAQGWLNRNYSKGKEREIIELDFSNQKLVGSLDFTDFFNLKKLNCSSNNLTELKNLSSNLEILYCSNNQLTNLDFLLDLDNEKLRKLNISNNKFKDELVPFSQLTNLKALELNANDFFGSFKYLKELTKLEKLNINDTNIKSGLEYLPNNLREFYCLNTKTIETKLKKIGKPQTNNNFIYLLQEWKINKNIKFVEKSIEELAELFKQQKEKIVQEEITQDYLHSSLKPPFEKNLLQKIVNSHLELTRVKKQNFSDIGNYRKQFNKLYSELTGKLNENQIQEVETILSGYEELVNEEQELEERKKILSLLLEEKKQISQMITGETISVESPQAAVIIRPIINSLISSKSRKEKNLSEQLLDKKKEWEESLAKLKNELKGKLSEELGFLLEMLLEMQIDIVEKGSDTFIEKKIQELRGILEEKINKEEIGDVSQKQKVITYLDEVIQFYKKESETKKREKNKEKLEEIKWEEQIEVSTLKK